MIEFCFQPFPELTTERLLLRQIVPDDATALYQLRTDEAAMRYIGRPRPQSVEEVTEGFIRQITEGMGRNESVAWAICLRHDPELIGTIGYHRADPANHRAEIGYMLAPASWSQGFMSEAIGPVIRYGFDEMGLHAIHGFVEPANVASSALLRKFGFSKEGYFRDYFYFGDAYQDMEMYNLLDTDETLARIPAR